MTDKDNANPLFDDDDDELTIPNLKDMALPVFKEPAGELPALGDFGMPEMPDEPMPSGVNNHTAPGSDAFSVDETIDDLLESIDDEPFVLDSDAGRAYEEDPLANILDSLGDLDSDFEQPIEKVIPPGTTASRFESMLNSVDAAIDDDDEQDYEGRFIDLDKVIGRAIELGASDIHLNADDEVAFTILGEITRTSDFGVLDSNMTVKLQQVIISNVLEQTFVEELELDTSYVVKTGKYKGRRLRLSVGKSEGAIFMVFRVISATMPQPDEIGIPKAVQNWFKLPSGLILINGPTGSGKSTSLSSLMQVIQFGSPKKVITLEKPIEFVYGKMQPGQKAVITQREIGRDSRSFESGLISAMRQAPDVILVGEVRFKAEIDQLLSAAETGHLAISTLHTTSCPATINRIRSMYEGDDQRRVLATLSDNLRGMMTQTLLMTPDGKSRVAVHEVLQINAELKNYILEGNVPAIREYMERNGITMEHELVKVVKAGTVDLNTARDKAPDPFYFDEILARA